MTDKPQEEVGDLTDDEFQAQCAQLTEQLSASNGAWHPSVIKSVFAEIVARTIAVNVDCLGCAAREAFNFDLGVRGYINDHWDEWQKRRAELLGIETGAHGAAIIGEEEDSEPAQRKVLH